MYFQKYQFVRETIKLLISIIKDIFQSSFIPNN